MTFPQLRNEINGGKPPKVDARQAVKLLKDFWAGKWGT